MLSELVPAAWHHVEQYATDPIEAITVSASGASDRCLDRRLARLRRVVITGHACVQDLRRGQYKLVLDVRPALRLAVSFAELARAI